MATNASLLPALSSEIAALTTRAAQLTLAVLGLGRRPVTATVIGQDLAVGVSHVIDADGLRVRTLDGRTLDASVAGRDDARDLVLLRVPGLNAASPATASALPAMGELLVSASRTWNGNVTSSLGVVGSVSGPMRTGRSGAVAQIIGGGRAQHLAHGLIGLGHGTIGGPFGGRTAILSQREGDAGGAQGPGRIAHFLVGILHLGLQPFDFPGAPFERTLAVGAGRHLARKLVFQTVQPRFVARETQFHFLGMGRLGLEIAA